MDTRNRWGARPKARVPLIGRDAEIDELSHALVGWADRLVSLVGPGGQGKTRLALAVADAIEDHFTDGAVFVSLSGVSEPSQWSTVVSAALGIDLVSGASPVDGLIEALAHRDMLLILDNFEQIRSAGPMVEGLLEGCDELRVLVTTRIPLDLKSEKVVALGPLAGANTVETSMVSSPAGFLSLGADKAKWPAIELFVDRATAVDPAFALGDHNIAAVLDVSRLLAGSPLAIELAASRLAILSIDDLQAGLASRPVALLGHGDAAMPDRQRSIQATIEWSYALLDAPQRSLLDALAVIEHGFDLDMAAAVVGSEPFEVIDPLQSLVDHHLVEVTRGSDGPQSRPRFALPRPVRDVVRDLIGESDTVATAADRLVEHVVAFGVEASLHLESPDEGAWLGRVGDDLDQIRSTLRVLADRSPQTALELAAALGPFWLHRGLLGEGREHLSAAVASPVDTTIAPELIACAAAWEARLAADQGVVAMHRDAERMLGQLQAGLAQARAAGDGHAELRAIDFLSHVLVLHGDEVEAMVITDEGIELARQQDRPWWLCQLLQRSAVFARLRGDVEAARRQAREASTLARSIGATRPLLHVGLTLAQLPDDPDDDAARDEGDVPTLADLLALAGEVGDKRMECVVRTSIGIEAMFAGDPATGANEFRQVLRLASDTGYWHAVGFGLMSTTALAVLVGQIPLVAKLHAVIVGEMDVLRRGMPPAYFEVYGQLIDDAGARSGAERFEAYMAEARSLDFARATVLAERFLDGVVAEQGATETEQAVASASPLTDRELEVLRLIAEGDTNKDVARRLSITPKTVMHHTSHIYQKLDVHGRAEAAAKALRMGLLDT